jgi:hypothetical protein
MAMLATVAVAGPVTAAAPDNDTIARARIVSSSVIGGGSGVTNAEATFSHEPTPSCQTSVGATVWYRYRPFAAMKATLSTSPQSTTVDTVLAVYKSTDNGLVQVACDDDGNGGLFSALTFTAAAGVSYYIQIGGYGGQTGQFSFDYSFNLANDAFASATSIKPGFVQDTNTYWASNQSGEPQGQCSPVSNTVWFKYKPSQTRTVSFDTFGSAFDTVVNVYRGTSLSNLVRITCADDPIQGEETTVVTWTAQKNKTYMIQVGGYSAASPKQGELLVNLVRIP